MPPAASAPVGEAPTSLTYHVQWYPAATTSPRCLHVFTRRGTQHGRAVVPSTLHCVGRRCAWGNSLPNISIEQPRSAILATCRCRLDLFANSAVSRHPKAVCPHGEQSKTEPALTICRKCARVAPSQDRFRAAQRPGKWPRGSRPVFRRSPF